MQRLFGCVALTLVLAGCAAQQQAQRTPLLYPNANLESKSHAQVQGDIEECDQKAQQYLPPRSTGAMATRVLLSALESGVVGTATGAVAGAIFSEAGRGAGAGAAVGGMTGAYGAIKELTKVDPRHRAFIKACLEEKGYRVIGWESDED